MGKILISLDLDNRYYPVLLHVCEGYPSYHDRQFDEVSTELENYWNSLNEVDRESLIIQARENIKAGEKKTYLPIIIKESMEKRKIPSERYPV